MGIYLANLDETTRTFMVAEIEIGPHYISPRLTQQGQLLWPSLITDAAENHDDDWLAEQLLTQGLIRNEEVYVRQGVSRTRSVNQKHAAQQLAKGEFNRFYLRGLCRRALAEGIDSLEVYRGKSVEKPRPESEAKIGTLARVDELLSALRTNDFVTIENAIGIPAGPSSGLTCKLPTISQTAGGA
jgi:hypothetical protein